jgi:hypothetical protein
MKGTEPSVRRTAIPSQVTASSRTPAMIATANSTRSASRPKASAVIVRASRKTPPGSGAARMSTSMRWPRSSAIVIP